MSMSRSTYKTTANLPWFDDGVEQECRCTSIFCRLLFLWRPTTFCSFITSPIRDVWCFGVGNASDGLFRVQSFLANDLLMSEFGATLCGDKCCKRSAAIGDGGWTELLRLEKMEPNVFLTKVNRQLAGLFNVVLLLPDTSYSLLGRWSVWNVHQITLIHSRQRNLTFL